MQEQGAKIVTAHWHATGIEKGLGADEIALGFLKAPADIFRPVRIRGDIYNLRDLVLTRNAVMDYRMRCGQRLVAVARSVGCPKKEDRPDWLQAAFSDAAKIESAADRKSTRLNSSHLGISYAVFCL